jgi:hypothetical protein
MTKTIALPIQGGCQCGALRYEIDRAPLMIYACHCTNCQRIAGSGFSLPATIVEDSLRFTRGTPSEINWKSDAGNDRYGLYCGDCGCRIAHGQRPSNSILSLRAGTFDDATWVEPAGHIWTRSALAWFDFKPDDILWETQPTDYVPIIQKFNTAVQFE